MFHIFVDFFKKKNALYLGWPEWTSDDDAGDITALMGGPQYQLARYCRHSYSG